MKNSFFIICILISNVCWAIAEFPLSESIQVINVFTGAPQPIDGPSKYAGFGDIAANLVAATELKARYPDRKIRLIVTSAQKRFDPLIPTTNEIMKIMAPSLDPEKKVTPQVFNGVEVVFLPYDFSGLLKEKWLRIRLPFLMWNMKRNLPPQVPPADLTLNFSMYPYSSPVLRTNSKLAIGVEEQYGGRFPVHEFQKPKNDQTGAYAEFTSGPYSLGYMVTHNQPDRKVAFQLIRQWAQKNSVTIPQGEFMPLIAYSAGWKSIQIYIEALKQIELPKLPVLLFVKDFPELNTESLPSSIQVIRVKGLPHEMMSALIQEAWLAPLVTGDISLGQALSTVRAGKSLVYESPEWKVESADGARLSLTKDLNLHESKLHPMFIKSEDIESATVEELRSRSTELAKVLADFKLQTQLANAIQNRSRQQWDLLGNALRLAEQYMDQVGFHKASEVKKQGWKSTKENLNRISTELLTENAKRSDVQCQNLL